MITRLAGLVGAVAIAATGVAFATGVSAHAADPLPAVNMEAVLKAAQWDPRKPDSRLTPGSGPSVLQVEKALHARGLLGKRLVDGHFGTATVKAYAAWQRSLGYAGLDASGLPGATSLKKLGSNRYSVARTVRPGARTTFNGVTMDSRTHAMLSRADDRIGPRLVMQQGSYSTSDPTSAGTHAGGGAVDIWVRNMSPSQRTSAVRELRRVGFAAWLRSPSQGDWPWHIHAVALGDPDLSPQAQHQAGDYYRGLNGLADRRPDDGPRVTKVTWEDYLRAL
jgi:hypothetical protein